MIAVWTLCRVWVAFWLWRAWVSAARGQRNWDACVAQAHDPDASTLEKNWAEHRLKQWERRVRRRNERVNLRAAWGKWIDGLTQGSLAYAATLFDASLGWVFWTLERSGTFDLWTWLAERWEVAQTMLPWA